MSTPTALVASAVAVRRELDGWLVVNHVSRFLTHAEFYRSRMDSLLKVKTEFFAIVDSDDDLPYDTAIHAKEMIDLMVEHNLDMVTGEQLSIHPHTGVVKVHAPGPVYDFDAHMKAPDRHHQVTMLRTARLLEVYDKLPKSGLFLPELIWYAMCARKDGSKYGYYPKLTYKWNANERGFHRKPDIRLAIENSARWLRQNVDLFQTS